METEVGEDGTVNETKQTGVLQENIHCVWILFLQRLIGMKRVKNCDRAMFFQTELRCLPLRILYQLYRSKRAQSRIKDKGKVHFLSV